MSSPILTLFQMFNRREVLVGRTLHQINGLISTPVFLQKLSTGQWPHPLIVQLKCEKRANKIWIDLIKETLKDPMVGENMDRELSVKELEK